MFHDAHLKIRQKVKAVKATQIAPNTHHAFLHVRTAVALSTSVFCAQSDSGAENVDWLDWKCALQLAKRSVEAC